MNEVKDRVWFLREGLFAKYVVALVGQPADGDGRVEPARVREHDAAHRGGHGGMT